MRKLGLLVLAAVVAGFVWFSAQDSSAAALTQRAVDVADARPVHSILFVGNSRTFYHDMPAMVREIADSAGSPEKLEVEMSAYGGASFESLWSNNRTRHLLREHWDDIILQGESRGQSNEELSRSFIKYGTLLGKEADQATDRPRLLVNWAYDPSAYTDGSEGVGRSLHMEAILAAHRQVADAANLHLVNLPTVWGSVRRNHPEIRMTVDGNHPTIAASYLVALAIYADLADRLSVLNVTYAPSGLSEKDAAALRATVAESWQ